MKGKRIEIDQIFSFNQVLTLMPKRAVIETDEFKINLRWEIFILGLGLGRIGIRSFIIRNKNMQIDDYKFRFKGVVHQTKAITTVSGVFYHYRYISGKVEPVDFEKWDYSKGDYKVARNYNEFWKIHGKTWNSIDIIMTEASASNTEAIDKDLWGRIDILTRITKGKMYVFDRLTYMFVIDQDPKPIVIIERIKEEAATFVFSNTIDKTQKSWITYENNLRPLIHIPDAFRIIKRIIHKSDGQWEDEIRLLIENKDIHKKRIEIWEMLEKMSAIDSNFLKDIITNEDNIYLRKTALFAGRNKKTIRDIAKYDNSEDVRKYWAIFEIYAKNRDWSKISNALHTDSNSSNQVFIYKELLDLKDMIRIHPGKMKKKYNLKEIPAWIIDSFYNHKNWKIRDHYRVIMLEQAGNNYTLQELLDLYDNTYYRSKLRIAILNVLNFVELDREVLQSLLGRLTNWLDQFPINSRWEMIISKYIFEINLIMDESLGSLYIVDEVTKKVTRKAILSVKPKMDMILEDDKDKCSFCIQPFKITSLKTCLSCKMKYCGYCISFLEDALCLGSQFSNAHKVKMEVLI